MIENDPLDPLRQQWLGERASRAIRISDLRAEAARRRRRLVLVVAGEVALTVALIVVTLLMLFADTPPAAGGRAMLGVLWSAWAAAVVFATWNRRGALTAQPGQEYVEQVTRFARMRVRTASFVFLATIALLMVLVAFGWATLPVGGVALLYAVWAVWYGSGARRDLVRFRRIAAEFRDDEGRV